MITGDFLKVIATWSMPKASEPILNVWYFQANVTGDATELQEIGEDIADSFVARYVTPLASAVSIYAKLNQIELRNMSDPSEGFTQGYTDKQGAVNAPAMPPFVTYSLRGLRYDLSMHNARKGLCGVPINAINTVGNVDTGYRTIFETVLDGWSTTDWTVETEGPDFLFVDKIVRNPSGPLVPPTRSSNITAWELVGFGSQNTRK